MSEEGEWWGTETEAALAPGLSAQAVPRPAPVASALQRGSGSLRATLGWTAAQAGSGGSYGVPRRIKVSRPWSFPGHHLLVHTSRKQGAI